MQTLFSNRFPLVLFGAWLCLLSVTGLAQQPDSIQRHVKDSLLQNLRKGLEAAPVEYAAKYKEHSIANEQDALLDALLKSIRVSRDFLKTGPDTNAIHQELANIREWYNIAADGVFTNTGTLQTERNLTTSYKLLHELLELANAKKLQVDAYKKKLVSLRHNFDSIASSPHLYATPADSTEFVQLVRKLYLAARQVNPIDSTLTASLKNVQHAKDELDLTVYQLQSGLEQISQYEKILAEQTFRREVSGLNEPPKHVRPLREILIQTIEKNKLIIWFYTRNNIGKVALLLLLTICCTVFLRTLKKKVVADGILRKDWDTQLVLRYPTLSAIMIVISIFQFIFPDPPFVFICILWVLASGSLTIIFHRFITTHWLRFWCVMWGLFLLACADNMILQASRAERWAMLGLAVAGMIVSALFLIRGRREDLREKWIVYFMYFIVCVELLSVIANLTGRFNLAKALMASGFISVIIAIMFLWTVRLINEALTLASDIYQTPERQLFFVNFAAVGRKAPLFFYFFLIIGWFILFARTFYAFKLVTQPVTDFLFDQRTIGQYSFSFFSVLAFFGILILSSVISKIVSFFASDKTNHSTDSSGAAGLGSWLLVVRIFIFVIGLLLAFAVAGIPLDKATFVMGALGVGIGFGLQSLVNNLVSGVILAFEKPLNVGDLVEVNGKAGLVQSIGFRSSVLHTLEGAHLVIPNGELLNDQLVNWNMQKPKRRSELTVGVSYDSNLEEVEETLYRLVKEQEHVMANPEPVIFATEFSDSSIQLEIYFWTPGLRSGKAAKSRLIFAIHTAFREQGIVIPYPQRDVHIKQDPEQREDKDDDGASD